MSESFDTTDEGEGMDGQLAKAAQLSGMEADPLAKYAEKFEGSGVDFFGLFINQSLSKQGLDDDTVDKYRRAFRFWKEHMERKGRHPAFPNDDHVKDFIEYERNEKENTQATVKNRLLKLQKAYDYWVEENHLPHSREYKPIELARMKVNLKNPRQKEIWPLSVEDIREVVTSISDIRSQVIVVLQLKLGLRAGEVANIQIQDFTIENSELQAEFPEMGTHRRVEDYEDTIYIPSREERDGNKSKRPRLLPLDDELRYLFLRYLLIRQSVEEPWLFLTERTYRQLAGDNVNEAWSVFHPEYEETEDYQKVTSHYGRHFFSTFWKVHQDLQKELVQYMRGDRVGSAKLEGRAAIDSYLHTHYDDIQDEYRQRIYTFDL